MRDANGNILAEIAAVTRGDVERQKQFLPPDEIRRLCAAHGRGKRDFCAALRRPGRGEGAAGRPRVIAELKKASPSAGVIRCDFQPLALAPRLEAAGAAALSVLTEPHWFQGSPAYLSEVSRLASVPVLRKDFVVDAYQIYQAELWGADAVLLIAAMLDAAALREFARVAADLGLAVLGEAHDAAELDALLAVPEIGAVGVNCRDLKTFKTDWEGLDALLRQIPGERVAVAESGIKSAADMEELPADAFLVGTTLMAAPDPAAALRGLLRP